MTPKDKAQEIFNSHYASIMEYGEDFGQEILVSILTIKASVITVDEILKAHNVNYLYWQKVKSEILKL